MAQLWSPNPDILAVWPQSTGSDLKLPHGILQGRLALLSFLSVSFTSEQLLLWSSVILQSCKTSPYFTDCVSVWTFWCLFILMWRPHASRRKPQQLTTSRPFLPGGAQYGLDQLLVYDSYWSPLRHLELHFPIWSSHQFHQILRILT